MDLHPFRANVRVIAATNRLPDEAIRAGILREDLFYRLSVFPIELPPLRERDDDIVLLAYHFLHQHNRDLGTDKVFSEAFIERLSAYSWPGNVRELQNCICRAFILADRVLDLPDIAPAKPTATIGAHGKHEFMVGTSLADMERDTIFATLDRCQGNKRRTAEMLRVSPQDALHLPHRRRRLVRHRHGRATHVAASVAPVQRRAAYDK